VVKISDGHVQGRPRAYCPTCGEVRGSAQYTHPQSGKAQVYGHTRTTGTGTPAACPGGPVDLGEDTAP
jgi:hypothetical protein